MKKYLAISLICAASASMAELDLSNKITDTPAGHWFAIEKCAKQGRISAEVAAFGKQIMREARAQFNFDQGQFDLLLAGLAKRHTKGLDPVLCNYVAMEIEEIRLQQFPSAAQVQAAEQLKQREQREAQMEEQLKQLQQREAQMAAQLDALRRQQAHQADAADKRREMEQITQQLIQMGQQFRDFGNSVRPRTTDCTRTMMGATCTTY